MQLKLDLIGRREGKFTPWTEQAYRFYNPALADPAVPAKLAPFISLTGSLEAGKALVDATEVANIAQEMLLEKEAVLNLREMTIRIV